MPDDLCHCPIYQSFIHTTSSDPGTCASRAGNISICKSEVEASISINASEAPKCNASAICFAMPVRECLIFFGRQEFLRKHHEIWVSVPGRFRFLLSYSVLTLHGIQLSSSSSMSVRPAPAPHQAWCSIGHVCT